VLFFQKLQKVRTDHSSLIELTACNTDEALDAQNDIISAPHVQLPMEPIISLSPACLSFRSPNSDSISSQESSSGPAPDWIHVSKISGLEGNHWQTFSGLATSEEQSLRGYLKVLAKQHLSGQADNVSLRQLALSYEDAQLPLLIPKDYSAISQD